MNFNVKEIFITGHRPDKLGSPGFNPYNPNPLQDWVRGSLQTAFDAIKPTAIITGMALGVDQWAAEIAIQRGIPFIAAVPFIGQEHMWRVECREHYHRLLAQAKETVIVSPGVYEVWKMQKRNEYMVDRGDLGVAVWDGTKGGTANCVAYALKLNKPIVQIFPGDFKL